jgi:pimeloyl-ACP methyl ester carboxylesterase
MQSYAELANLTISAPSGVDYSYRDTGGHPETAPLVLLQHFRGNLDYWDPALIDALAAGRRVITFDNAGVGGSTGETPDTIEQMARDAIAFITALGLSRIDLLGFASSAPKGATGMHGWAPAVIGAVGKPDRDEMTDWATREAQYDAVCTWGIPDHAALERLAAIEMPALVANGDSDPMILPRYSHLLAGLIPLAELKIYPGAAHRFLFQHHAEFAADVARFLETSQAMDDQ